jgi:hypothetical protein
MTGKKKSLTGRIVRPGKGKADGRDQRGQFQNTQNPRFKQYHDSPEQYRRDMRRMLADAFVMAQSFPARLRFSYYVDRNGCLRCLSERRAAG